MRSLRLASLTPGSRSTGAARRPARRIGPCLLTLTALSTLVLVAPPASAAARACVAWSGAVPASPGIQSNGFSAVAVLSPCYTWAVGTWQNNPAEPQTLIEHFNGSDWTKVASPQIGADNDDDLNGVAVTSKSNAWAVGSWSNGTAEQTLTLRWNGSSWTHVNSPNPAGIGADDVLNAVAATSATNAWAVGSYRNAGVEETLIERWNGHIWKVVPSPTPGTTSVLYAVAATSASNAWAAGTFFNGSAFQTLILRWNGTVWKKVPSPNPGGASNGNFLRDVDVTSGSDAWAVGDYHNGTTFRTLIEHWNGTVWKTVPSPNPGGPAVDNILYGVAATSASNAVAVGSYRSGGVLRTLTERWNGSHWRWAWSPNPSPSDNVLYGVDASSATNAWAVGYSHGPPDQTLGLHCC